MIITRPESILTCVYIYVSGCLWAYICSCISWVWLWVHLKERESVSFLSLWVSYGDSVALDLCSVCCDAVLCCVLLYRVVFLIGFDVLQLMCTDRGWFGKPQSISPITALAVRLTFWICYSTLFKLEHSLISCPWAAFVGSDCSACTLSQACTQCRRCTVCLQKSQCIQSRVQKEILNYNRFQSCKKWGLVKKYFSILSWYRNSGPLW